MEMGQCRPLVHEFWSLTWRCVRMTNGHVFVPHSIDHCKLSNPFKTTAKQKNGIINDGRRRQNSSALNLRSRRLQMTEHWSAISWSWQQLCMMNSSTSLWPARRGAGFGLRRKPGDTARAIGRAVVQETEWNWSWLRCRACLKLLVDIIYIYV